jgi:hypothetical protein
MLHDEAHNITKDGAFSLVTGDAAGGILLVGYTIDLTAVREIAAGGKPLAFHLQCTEMPAIATNLPFFEFMVVAGSDSSLSTIGDRLILGSSMKFGATGSLHGAAFPKAKDRFQIPICEAYLGGHGEGQGIGDGEGTAAVPGTLQTVFGRRYLGLIYLNSPRALLQGGTADHTFNAGKFTARFGLAGGGSGRTYAIGHTIV